MATSWLAAVACAPKREYFVYLKIEQEPYLPNAQSDGLDCPVEGFLKKMLQDGS